MKKLFFCLLCFTTTSALFAQLLPDQNPNYEISRTRYMAAKDSLLGTQLTTVQNTYKAYDWMQLRQERKDIRFENRQQRRLNRSQYVGYYEYENSYPYDSYNNNYRNGYYYNNSYRNSYYPNRSYYRSGFRFSDVWWRLFF